jgi:hypothetical protein
VATQPRSPSEHYLDAERLLGAAESGVTDTTIQIAAALAAIGHAVLANVPPRRARRRPDRTPPRRPSGGSPAQRWIHGDAETT